MNKTKSTIPPKRKIKVCHIITKMVYGGASLGTLRLVHDIDPELFQTAIICGSQSKDEGNLLKDIKDKHFDVIIIPEIVREITIIKDIIVFVKLVHLMKKNRYDIVHTHGSRISAIARLAAAYSRVPIILYTIHGWTLKAGLSFTFVFRIIERILAKFTTKFLFQTKADLNEAFKYKIGKPKQYSLIGNGIDLKPFLNCRRERVERIKKEFDLKNKKIIGTVGRISVQKNPKGFIDIARKVTKKRNDVIFIFVGGGELLEDMKSLVKRYNLQKRIIFTGVRKDIPEIVSNFDIFILPSFWEGMPRSVIEAMVLSKPVVVHNIGGIDEIVKDGISGLIVPINQTTEFAEKIEFLLNTPKLCKKIGESGKITAKKYDFDKVVRKTEKIYLELAV